MQNKKLKKLISIIIILIIGLTLAPKSDASEKDITSSFKDKNFKTAILELAQEVTGDENKTKIYESDIDKIVSEPGGTSLKLANKGITNLSGIENFKGKGITWLFLDWNEITDLTPLQNLEELTKVSFSGNSVTDLTPLSKLPNLKNITGINNKIETIEPLTDLQNIEYICLDGNNISSINSIMAWQNLKEMSFNNNKIKEMPDLTKLTQLRTIDLSNNLINNINKISTAQTLEKLEIDNNQITDLTGIESLNNLKILSCSNNQINSIEKLANNQNLENLNLNVNEINNIEELANNANLKYLYLDNNKISDFDSLTKIANIEKYSIYNQNISYEIKNEVTESTIDIDLPKMYTDLFEPNSYIYKDNLNVEVTGTQDYEINDENTQIKLNLSDLQNNSIILKVSDSENTILKYEIYLDQKAPTINGVENGKIYTDVITINSNDDDIKTVKLLKDGEEISYNLGEEIREEGKYTIEVSDYMNNKTTISFELKYNFESQLDGYILENNYIKNIAHDTTLNIFNSKIKDNIKYSVYRNNKELTGTQIVATGDVLKTETGDKYTLVVAGDINQDGKITAFDMAIMKKYLLGVRNLDELEELAADVNCDNKKIAAMDYAAMKNIFLGRK